MTWPLLAILTIVTYHLIVALIMLTGILSSNWRERRYQQREHTPEPTLLMWRLAQIGSACDPALFEDSQAADLEALWVMPTAERQS